MEEMHRKKVFLRWIKKKRWKNCERERGEGEEGREGEREGENG